MRNSVVLLGVMVLLAGCTEKVEYTTIPGSGIMAVTDDHGRNITLDGVPDRIVSTAPSNTEILFALGLGDKVVGVTEYCNYPPEATKKEKIGGFSTVSVERVIALNPDLIVASDMTGKDNLEKIEELGIPVIVLKPKSIDDILGNIELIGKLTGRDSKASRLVADMRKRISAVKTRSSKERPKVLYLVWHDPPMAGGKETFVDDLIKKGGGVNIANFDGWKVMNLETIVNENPDIIIVPFGHGSNQNKTLDFVREEPSLKTIDAVKNGRIYTIDGDIVSRPGPRIVDALEKFGNWIGNETFT